MLIVLTFRHIDGILLAVITCNTSCVKPNIHEIISGLQDKLIDCHLIVCLDFLSVSKATVCFDFLIKVLLVHHRERCLLDIEQDTYLSATDSLVVRLLFGSQCFVLLTADLVFGIVLILVLIPVIPVERYTFLTRLYTLTTLLGFAKQSVFVGLVIVLITVKSQDDGIEG